MAASFEKDLCPLVFVLKEGILNGLVSGANEAVEKACG